MYTPVHTKQSGVKLVDKGERDAKTTVGGQTLLARTNTYRLTIAFVKDSFHCADTVRAHTICREHDRLSSAVVLGHV